MGHVILFSGWYSPELCRSHPHKTFVFGDNMLRFGKGGQAIIRDEPNAYGVVTKRKPAMTNDSFFREGNEHDMDAVLADLSGLWDLLKIDGTVVVPITEQQQVSLGCERACLPEVAPSIYDTIVRHVDEMCDAYLWSQVSNADALLSA